MTATAPGPNSPSGPSRRRRTLVIVAVIAATAPLLVMVGTCTRKPAQGTPQAAAQTAKEQPAETTVSAEPPATGEDTLYTPTYKAKGDEVAVVQVTRGGQPLGTVRFTFYSEDAPNHAGSFIELAKKGFYDGTSFHRVEPNFVVQGGDPNTKSGQGTPGTGGPGYNLKAEFNSRKHLDGTVAMARSQDPDSAGSQFYICLGPQSFLDGQYTVFGQVTEGMEVVRTIKAGDVMTSVTIENAD